MTENSMVIPLPADPFYQPEPEEMQVEIPMDRAMLLRLLAWSVEKPDVAWSFLDAYVEAGHPAGERWEMVKGEVTHRGVKVTCRRTNG